MILATPTRLVSLLCMLCERCHERPATVHITQKTAGQSDKKLDLCDVCFPIDGSEKEQAEMMTRLFKDKLPDEASGSEHNTG